MEKHIEVFTQDTPLVTTIREVITYHPRHYDWIVRKTTVVSKATGQKIVTYTLQRNVSDFQYYLIKVKENDNGTMIGEIMRQQKDDKGIFTWLPLSPAKRGTVDWCKRMYLELNNKPVTSINNISHVVKPEIKRRKQKRKMNEAEKVAHLKRVALYSAQAKALAAAKREHNANKKRNKQSSPIKILKPAQTSQQLYIPDDIPARYDPYPMQKWRNLDLDDDATTKQPSMHVRGLPTFRANKPKR